MFNRLYEMYRNEAIGKGGEYMTRLRTINKAYDEIKARDPDTAVSRRMFRDIVRSGMIPSIARGNRSLVDVDVAESCLLNMAGSRPGSTESAKQKLN